MAETRKDSFMHLLIRFSYNTVQESMCMVCTSVLNNVYSLMQVQQLALKRFFIQNDIFQP